MGTTPPGPYPQDGQNYANNHYGQQGYPQGQQGGQYDQQWNQQYGNDPAYGGQGDPYQQGQYQGYGQGAPQQGYGYGGGNAFYDPNYPQPYGAPSGKKSVLANPILWIIVGLLTVGGIAAAIFLVFNDDDDDVAGGDPTVVVEPSAGPDPDPNPNPSPDPNPDTDPTDPSSIDIVDPDPDPPADPTALEPLVAEQATITMTGKLEEDVDALWDYPILCAEVTVENTWFASISISHHDFTVTGPDGVEMEPSFFGPDDDISHTFIPDGESLTGPLCYKYADGSELLDGDYTFEFSTFIFPETATWVITK